MAWRRGFFRLWLVMSILWIGFVVFIVGSDYRAAVSYVDRMALVPAICGDNRGQAGVDYGHDRSAGIGPWDRYKTDAGAFDVCWFRPTSFRRLYPERVEGLTDQQVLSAAYTYSTTERPPVVTDPVDQIWDAVPFILIPPVALLVIGLIVTWVVSGFRRPTT